MGLRRAAWAGMLVICMCYLLPAVYLNHIFRHAQESPVPRRQVQSDSGEHRPGKKQDINIALADREIHAGGFELATGLETVSSTWQSHVRMIEPLPTTPFASPVVKSSPADISDSITTTAPAPSTVMTVALEQPTIMSISSAALPPPATQQPNSPGRISGIGHPCGPPDWYITTCTQPGFPIVFALMITGKDLEHVRLAHLAMRSFVQQTHPSKAMIILNDGTVSVKAGSEFFSDQCICEVIIPHNSTRKLGELRNMLVRMVPENQVWVQWDDDDWRNRTCMQGQLRVMVNESADVVFLRRQLHVDMLWNSTFKYEYGHWGIWGTVMANSSNPVVRTLSLPNLDRGEDLEYDAVKAKVKWVLWDNVPQMYFRIIHGRNTWNRAHFKPDLRFRRNVWCLLVQECTDDLIRDTKEIFALYRAALPPNENVTV